LGPACWRFLTGGWNEDGKGGGADAAAANLGENAEAHDA
jgi:hypothetical protein